MVPSQRYVGVTSNLENESRLTTSARLVRREGCQEMILVLPLLFAIGLQTATESAQNIGPVEPCFRSLCEDRVVSVQPPLRRGTLLVDGEAPFVVYKEMVALACSGTWFKRGDELSLGQTPEQAVARGVAARQRRIDSLQAHLEELAESTGGAELRPRTLEEAAAASSRLRLASAQLMERNFNGRVIATALEHLPGRRLIRGCVSMLPMDVIARIPVGGRVVFATSPNRDQLALPRSKDALAAYNTDMERIRAGSKWVQAESQQGNMRVSIPGLAVLKNDALAARILVSASRSRTGLPDDSIKFQLLCVDAQDSIMDEARMDLSISNVGIVPPAFSASRAEVTLSARCLRGLGLCQRKGPYAEDQWKGPNDDVDSKRALSTVVQGQEPLGLCVAEIIMALARAQNLKLMALLPDSVARLPFHLTPKANYTVSELSRAIAETSSVDMEIEGNWLIVKPIFAEDGEHDYLDRKSIRELVSSDSNFSSVNQIALSRFYVANPTAGDRSPLGNMVVKLALPGRDIPQQPNAEWLRFHAASERPLSSSVEGAADMSELSRAQLQALIPAITSNPYGFRIGKNIRQLEPTEWMETPLAGSLGWKRRKFYRLVFSVGGAPSPPLDLPTVADAIAGRRPSEAEMIRWSDMIGNRTYSSITIVNSDVLDIRFTSPGLTAGCTVDASRTEGNPVRSIDDLPSLIQNLIKKGTDSVGLLEWNPL